MYVDMTILMEVICSSLDVNETGLIELAFVVS